MKGTGSPEDPLLFEKLISPYNVAPVLSAILEKIMKYAKNATSPPPPPPPDELARANPRVY